MAAALLHAIIKALLEHDVAGKTHCILCTHICYRALCEPKYMVAKLPQQAVLGRDGTGKHG